MRLFHEFDWMLAVSSEVADGPMGSSTNPGLKTEEAPEGEFAANRERFLESLGLSADRLSMLGLVHRGRIAPDYEITAGSRVPNSDAAIMERRLFLEDQPVIGVPHADCLAFVIGMPDILAAGHAGWRGLVNERLPQRVIHALLQKYGVSPQDLWVAVFPALQVCHFEVDASNHEDGAPVYEESGYGDFVLWGGEKPLVDLRGIFIAQCGEMGVPADHIEAVWRCTYCEPRGLLSSRRNRHQKLPDSGQNMMLAVTFVSKRYSPRDFR